MLMLVQILALLACALFAGAAIYINLVEHPARMAVDTKTAHTLWAPSYARATKMQAPLAIVSFLSGVLAWALGGGVVWLVAAILIGSVVPFTLIVIKPTNDRLLTLPRDGSADARTLLERWGRLHAVRSSSSLLATLLYLAALTNR